MKQKLTIYRTDSHDHQCVMLDTEQICLNDYSNENTMRLAKKLGIEIEVISLSGEEFEERFS